jgi:hypothetical protein
MALREYPFVELAHTSKTNAVGNGDSSIDWNMRCSSKLFDFEMNSRGQREEMPE